LQPSWSSFFLKGIRLVPIILTGAMTPLGSEGGHGLQNLTEGLFATHLLGPGVSVVIHGQVFPIDRVRKDKVLGTFVEIAEQG
jgi:L-asparaginase/Glu-tRNA(Gln) amidotransferase subunit D